MALLADRWRGAPDGSVVDVEAALLRATLQVVGRSLFSVDLSDPDDRRVRAVADALDGVLARARSPLARLAAIPTPASRRTSAALEVLETTVAEIVAGRVAADQDGQPSCDLLGLLLASGSSQQQVRAEVVTLIVAGHETVASALTWACWLLAADPGVGARLSDEVDRVLGDRAPRDG